MKPRVTLCAVMAALAAAGCTSMPTDLGQQEVNALTAERGRTLPDQSASSLIEKLSQEPLNRDSAVALALANNPELALRYAELGLGAAAVYAAGRIRNPVLAAELLHPNRSGEDNALAIDLVGSLTDLLTLGARKRLAAVEFAALQAEVGARVLETAVAAEKAYVDYVAARQRTLLQEQITKAADLSLQLAQRYYDAGNLPPRQYAMAQGAAAEQRLHSLEAQTTESQARNELAGVLGIAADKPWRVPGHLPEPGSQTDALADLQLLASQSRLDLKAAMARIKIAEDQAGITRRTRWWDELDAGVVYERETDGGELIGPTVEWELPLFSQGQDAQLRSMVAVQQAVIAYRKLSVDVCNQVQLAHAAMANAEARAQTYQQLLIPARMAATQRAQEEENFMLIGTFELIEVKQDEYAAYAGYLDALRDYWLARTDLRYAVGNSLPSSTEPEGKQIHVESLIQPPADSGHGQHDAPQTQTPAPEQHYHQHPKPPQKHREHQHHGHGRSHQEH